MKSNKKSTNKGKGMTDTQKGVVIGAVGGLAVAVPVTWFVARKCTKEEYREKAAQMNAAAASSC